MQRIEVKSHAMTEELEISEHSQLPSPCLSVRLSMSLYLFYLSGCLCLSKYVCLSMLEHFHLHRNEIFILNDVDLYTVYLICVCNFGRCQRCMHGFAFGWPGVVYGVVLLSGEVLRVPSIVEVCLAFKVRPPSDLALYSGRRQRSVTTVHAFHIGKHRRSTRERVSWTRSFFRSSRSSRLEGSDRHERSERCVRAMNSCVGRGP